MMSRISMVIFLLLISLSPSMFYFGPMLEAKLLPVLDLDVVDIRFGKRPINMAESTVLFFKIHVIKNRPCKLETFSFRWLLDHNADVTPVFRATDNLPYQPSPVSGGEFRSVELWTAIPSAAYNYPHARFRGTTYYECHALWPLAFYFELDVKIPVLNLSQDRSNPVRRRLALLGEFTNPLFDEFTDLRLVRPPTHGIEW